MANNSPEQSIRNAYPGDDDLHRSVRVALLRILHHGVMARHELDFVAEWLQSSIEDPPWCLWYGPIRPLELAKELHRAADAIEHACTALDAARLNLNRFTDSEKGSSDGLHTNRAGRHEPGDSTITPF